MALQIFLLILVWLEILEEIGLKIKAIRKPTMIGRKNGMRNLKETAAIAAMIKKLIVNVINFKLSLFKISSITKFLNLKAINL